MKNWLCYYGASFGPDIYGKFDMVVLDGHNHPPLPDKKGGKPVVCGYLSLGEVNVNSYLWPLVKGKPFLVKKNEQWDSWIVDVRDAEWRRILFETALPDIFKQGFDGVFLDTIDSSLSLENGVNSSDFPGTSEALKDIIAGMRNKFPGKFIIVNRGLPLLPDIAANIDFVVVESLFSFYAGHAKGYIYVDHDTRQILLNQVEKGTGFNKKLVVLTLDYAGEDDFKLAKEAIEFSRKRGFIPYVSTYLLDQIFLHTLNK